MLKGINGDIVLIGFRRETVFSGCLLKVFGDVFVCFLKLFVILVERGV